jgi:hypothetical protein
MTPYHTGKVAIGLLYEPPKPYHDRDARLLQTALLNKRQPGTLELIFVGLLRRFWGWA